MWFSSNVAAMVSILLCSRLDVKTAKLGHMVAVWLLEDKLLMLPDQGSDSGQLIAAARWVEYHSYGLSHALCCVVDVHMAI